MGLERVGTFVSDGKKKRRFNETERTPGFLQAELFRSGESIFLLDRNPIWMTPLLPPTAYSRP